MVCDSLRWSMGMEAGGIEYLGFLVLGPATSGLGLIEILLVDIPLKRSVKNTYRNLPGILSVWMQKLTKKINAIRHRERSVDHSVSSPSQVTSSQRNWWLSAADWSRATRAGLRTLHEITNRALEIIANAINRTGSAIIFCFNWLESFKGLAFQR